MLGVRMSGLNRIQKINERRAGLSQLFFLEECGLGYRIKGTPYVYFLWQGEWTWDDLNNGDIISFEVVFENVSEAIRDEIIFNFDLFK
jgi:hypothetical protein